MKDKQKAEEIAAQRVQLLSPLLAEGLDPAKAKELKAKICEQTGLSERTLRRYLERYRRKGFSGLKPMSKGRQPSEAVIALPLMEQAILLRREVPGRIAPGEIKRSTLQEKLTQRGYSSRHMRMYAESGVAARRFQQRHRNRLWHSDIKYGPYLPIGPGGAMKQVFLVTFVDDATRFVLHGEFYPVMDKSIIEDVSVVLFRNMAYPRRCTSTTGSNTERSG
uniref:helix-turn-helix domain-containing protein n=1 Tax=Paenibacillus alginolyticus TaxID=59839 RepID=UPI001FE78EB0|nr:helix-turn-helix domain-containing protein [Paenibacillus frigoriresistens]